MNADFLDSPDLPDERFVDNLYNIMLGRDPDPSGRSGLEWQLSHGVSRKEIIRQFADSPEFQRRLVRWKKSPGPLPSLVAQRPDKYSRSGDFLIFNAAHNQDFDWLEQSIRDHGYYERPGPWSYGVDYDKTVLAAMIASLGVARTLEVGCGDGSVIACLDRLGVASTGVDISQYAQSLALPHIRPLISVGDILEMEGLEPFQLICAFDLVEHVSPNKIDKLLNKMRNLLEHGGLALFNTPAFGNDRIFGLVHGYWIQEWRGEERRATLWMHFPCYETGFPLMGHLIWADSIWWEDLFARHGLRRLDAVERSLHSRFDTLMGHSAARRSYFVLGNDVSEENIQSICRAIAEFDLDNALVRCGTLISK